MLTCFDRIRITGVAAALPDQILPLHCLSDVFGVHDVERIIASTGISSVRLAGSLSTGDLCEAASRRLIQELEIDGSTIDAIVLVTQTPDMLMPATSVLLQHRLGLSSQCLAFDINYGCSGYVYGLLQAALLLQSSGCRRVLLCTGDVTTKLLHPDDRHVRMVFGDAGSATLLEKGTDSIDILIETDGGGAGHLNTPLSYEDGEMRHASSAQVGHLHMDGTAIMGFALDRVPKLIDALLVKRGETLEDVGCFLLHQANRFMLNYLRKLLRVPTEKLPIAIHETGNTGPASIPLLMSFLNGRLPAGRERSLLCGFGVGLSVGVASTDLSRTTFCSPTQVAQPLPSPELDAT
jgi:3-oxoacyl-[acyl-carrier-protein] synthase-3